MKKHYVEIDYFQLWKDQQNGNYASTEAVNISRYPVISGHRPVKHPNIVKDTDTASEPNE